MSKGAKAKTKESKSQEAKQHKPASKQKAAYLVLEAASYRCGPWQV